MTDPNTKNFDAVVDEFIRTARPEFRPYAHYSPTADAVFMYMEDVPVFRKRLDSKFTILLSAEDKTFAGCVVKEIKSMFRDRSIVTFKLVIEEFIKTQPDVVWDENFDPRRLGEVKEQELCLN